MPSPSGTQISNYTQRAVAEIQNRKDAYAAEKKRLAEKALQIDSDEAETNQCKLKEIELIKVLDKEQEERKEAEASVAAFRRQLNSVEDKCASLDVEIEQHRVVVANLLRERKREQDILGAHAARAHPEVAACEAALKCVVEGIGQDKILAVCKLEDALHKSTCSSTMAALEHPAARSPRLQPHALEPEPDGRLDMDSQALDTRIRGSIRLSQTRVCQVEAYFY
ncbi:hypothetical protein TRAPUB_3711 [Trametes pubescens]|uniref:Uncharacterized protein n=1 Tax=Trametes pubescens TaxID=154538 RepID=A0A1M2VD11_TRAPU|nr:hypothetical protein TRAPUB_3711 [Trametes pubescens]